MGNFSKRKNEILIKNGCDKTQENIFLMNENKKNI